MSPDTPPVACTLTAAEMPKRLAELRAIGESALISSETSDSAAENDEGLRLTIHSPAGGEPVMRELVAAFRGENPVAA